jgi:hypothetical protein
MILSKKFDQTNTAKKKKQSEDTVVDICVDYLKKLGWMPVTLYTGGIPTKYGRLAKNPAKGIPDKIFFNFSKHKMIWVEFKKSHSGIVSNEQKAWHVLLKHCSQTVFLVNSLDSLIEQLIEMEKTNENETFERAS